VSRAIVLIVCLAAAGAVAAYTHYYSQEAADPTPVFTVRVPAQPPQPVSPTTTGSIHREAPVPEDRASLVRALQRELKRVGCYGGEINGVWTTSSRMAMKSFTDEVNASLPIDNPDQVLLSLVRGRSDRACGTACPSGQTASDVGRCAPTAVLAKTDNVTETPIDKQNTLAPAVAAGAALAAAGPKGETRTGPADDRRRSVATTPDTGTGSERLDRSTRQSGPIPPERVNERRKRRYGDPSPPPKFVRDFFRAFGIR
jgi:hypothetical protein